MSKDKDYDRAWIAPSGDTVPAWEAWLTQHAPDASAPLKITATLGHAWAGSKTTISGTRAHVFEPVLLRIEITCDGELTPLALMRLTEPQGTGAPLDMSFWDKSECSAGITAAMYATLSQHFISHHRQLTDDIASTHTVLEDVSKGPVAPVRQERLEMDFRVLVRHMVADRKLFDLLVESDGGQEHKRRWAEASFAKRMLEVPFNRNPMSQEAFGALVAEFRDGYSNVMEIGQFYSWLLRSEKMLSTKTTDAEADELSSIYGGGKKTREKVYEFIDRWLDIGWNHEQILIQLHRVMDLHPRHRPLATTMIDERLEARADARLQAQTSGAAPAAERQR